MNYAPVLMCLSASLLAAGISCRGEQPVQSDAFVDSAGVNVHLHYTDTLYYSNFPLIESSLKTLGVRHVRDAIIDTTLQAYYDRHNQLGADGIHGLFSSTIGQSSALLQQWPSRVAGSFEAYEGPNEYDQSSDPNWAVTLQAFLPVLYAAAHASIVPTAPVVAPSLTLIPSYAALGNVTASADMGNMHNYHDGRNPGTAGWWGGGYTNYGSTPWNLQMEAVPAGAEPVWSTETGYDNDMTAQGSLPESVSALYLPRTYLMGWIYGSPRTYLYELLSSPGQDFGLLRSNGSAKPGFGAVSNLLTLLADPGPAFTPTDLAYTITGGDSTLRHLLLQKRDGSYYLTLWLESAVYDVNANAPLTVAPQPLTINVSRQLQSATTYQLDAAGGMTTTQLTTAEQFTVTASPAVLIVKLVASSANLLSVTVPAAGGGTVSVSPTSPNGYYSAGQTVIVSAVPNIGYQFAGFTGDIVNSASSVSVSMATNQSLVATFGCGVSGEAAEVGAQPASLNVPQAAGASNIAVTAGNGCGWNALSGAPWLTVSPATGSGNGALSVGYNSNTGAERVGQVSINSTAVPVTQAAQQLVPVTLTLTTNYGTTAQSGSVTSHILTHSATAVINVDGALVTTPATVNWYAGSTHTLSTVQPQFILGQPYIGFGWVPGGPGLTSTVTAPASAAAYKQNMVSAVLLSTSVGGGGTIAISPDPAATGGYYMLGESIGIVATPNPGCSFSGFSGNIASTSPSITIFMAKGFSVAATFSCP